MGKGRDNLIQFMQKEKPEVYAEIGVWRGDFAARVLKEVKPKKMYLIDPWLYDQEPENQFYIPNRKIVTCQDDMDKVAISVVERFKDNNNVVIYRNKSEIACDLFDDDIIDWVYIDGMHTYDAVMKDLCYWFDCVKVNGYITGDDYDWGPQFQFPVRRAVNEFMENIAGAAVEKVYIRDGQFILRKVWSAYNS